MILYIVLAIVAIILLVMLLKKVLHLTVEDGNYSDDNDYLERRMKKDEENK